MNVTCEAYNDLYEGQTRIIIQATGTDVVVLEFTYQWCAWK